LAQKKRKKYGDAIKSVELAIEKEDSPPYLVLRAQLAETVGDQENKDACLSKALSEFPPLQALDDWALGWYLTATIMAHDNHNETRARNEQRRRRPGQPPILEGEPPQGPRALIAGE